MMPFKARSLFVKIFLWFWLVTALSSVILFIVAVTGDVARNKEVREQRADERRRRMSETLSFAGETGVKIMTLEGPEALDNYSEQMARTAGIKPFFFFRPYQPEPERKLPPDILELVERVWQTDKTEYISHGDEFVLAKPMKTPSGNRYIIVGKTQLDSYGSPSPAPRRPPREAVDVCRSLKPGDDCSMETPNGPVHGHCEEIIGMPLACIPDRPPGRDMNAPHLKGNDMRPPPPGPPAQLDSEEKKTQSRFFSRIMGGLDHYSLGLGKFLLIMFLIGGLACYLLTCYLTSPLRRLQAVAQKLADGDLSARVGHGFKGRGDEIAELGEDIDRMAERIEGLIQSQSRLLRDISHELRSPLARLNVALELARKSPGNDNTTYLDRIERESNRLNELISQLLTLTRLESGNARINKETVDLEGLMNRIAGDVNFEAERSNRRVAIVKKEPISVTGNRELLLRTIENIIRNAVRYTRENTVVELSLYKKVKNGNPWAIIKIRDYGPGVPDSELSNIFKPFYRVSNGRERESGGIGVGLAISERAVRLHGGIIYAENSKDQGLTVTIELPAGTVSGERL